MDIADIEYITYFDNICDSRGSLLPSFDIIYICRLHKNKTEWAFFIIHHSSNYLKTIDRDINVNIGKISAYSSSDRTHSLHL